MGFNNMNILIPMAGRGQRFAETGHYNVPKPLIEVQGTPMIVKVLDNIGIKGNYIFLILKEFTELLSPLLNKRCSNCIIIEIDKVTEGAACTCLLAKEYINNDEQLLVANCDQIMDWDRESFLLKVYTEDVDGYILTYNSNSPKNSFAKINRHGYITRVAEKQVISDLASCGVYHWSKGRYMVNSCEKMIAKNIRCNNEFYLCPSYNEMIEDGMIVKTLPVKHHYPIGTPEDLEAYLNENRQNV